MVCLSSASPRGGALVRKGSRLAGRLSTDWFVVFVETPAGDARAHRRRGAAPPAANTELARELGAEVVRLRARDPVRRDPGLRALARRRPHRRRALAPAVLEAAVRASIPMRLVREARRPRRAHRVATEDEEARRDAADEAAARPGAAGDRAGAGGRAVGGCVTTRLGRPVAAHPGRQLPQRARGPADEGGARAHRQRRAVHRAGQARGRRGRGRSRANRRAFEKRACGSQEGNITEAGEGRSRARCARPGTTIAQALDALPGARRQRRARARLLRRPAARVRRASSSAPTTSWRSTRTRWCARAIASRERRAPPRARSSRRRSRWRSSSACSPPTWLIRAHAAPARRRHRGGAALRRGRSQGARRRARQRRDRRSSRREFNRMAERLERYRASSLGELLQAQQAAQAAIDGLAGSGVAARRHGQAAGRERGGVLAARGRHRSAPARRAGGHRSRACARWSIACAAHVLAGKGAYVPKGFEEAVRVPPRRRRAGVPAARDADLRRGRRRHGRGDRAAGHHAAVPLRRAQERSGRDGRARVPHAADVAAHGASTCAPRRWSDR